MTAAAAKAFITDPAGSTSAQDVRDAIDVIYGDQAGAGVYQAWAPVLTAATTNPTLGTGSSATGRYARTGNLITGHGQITFGTAGVNAGSGSYIVSLPVEAHVSGFENFVHGWGYFFDSSTSALRAVTLTRNSATAAQFLIVDGSAFASSAVPWTWAASDALIFNIMYEAVAV